MEAAETAEPVRARAREKSLERSILDWLQWERAAGLATKSRKRRIRCVYLYHDLAAVGKNMLPLHCKLSCGLRRLQPRAKSREELQLEELQFAGPNHHEDRQNSSCRVTIRDS